MAEPYSDKEIKIFQSEDELSRSVRWGNFTPSAERFLANIDALNKRVAELEKKLKNPTVSAVYGYEAGLAESQSCIASLEEALEKLYNAAKCIDLEYPGFGQSLEPEDEHIITDFQIAIEGARTALAGKGGE